jgi:hypothetical protein
MSKKNRRIDEVAVLFDEAINIVSVMSDVRIDSLFNQTARRIQPRPRAKVIAAATKALSRAGHLIRPETSKQPLIKRYKIGLVFTPDTSRREALLGEQNGRKAVSPARHPGRFQG